jgi:circadian clock protein KaiB
MATYVFRLYVAGQTALSLAAVNRLKSLCQSRLRRQYELEVIDVATKPEMADEDMIVVIPTVIRCAPLPQRRVLGDLGDDERTAAALGFPDPLRLASEDAHHETE